MSEILKCAACGLEMATDFSRELAEQLKRQSEEEGAPILCGDCSAAYREKQDAS